MGDELIGQKLGKYEIIRKIGEGGMGTVYEGRHGLLDQKVAVKVLADGLIGNAEAAKRFIQEGQFLGRLRHDNIVPVFDLGEENGTHYLAMEYVEGKPLTWLIDYKGKVKPARALDIARQVADALAVAHERSVVHRDIKPDNIMVNATGKVKVMDFGIAKELVSGSTKLTVDGASIGTAHYMSPEQCKGVPVDQRSDIFSLGVVLFEMLTGELPYSEDLAHLELMNTIANGPFPSARAVNGKVTKVIDTLLRKMTAVDVDKRYDSATELSDDIRYLIRIKAYRPDVAPVEADPIVDASEHPSGEEIVGRPDGEVIERSTVGRRKADRELAERANRLQEVVERLEGGKREERYAVRKKCNALLHEDCVAVVDIDMGVPPRKVVLLDLSEGGTSLFIDEKLAKPSRHVIELRLEDGTIVRSPAEVTWTRFIEKRDGYATGFKFVDTPREEEMNLHRALSDIRMQTQSSL